MNDKDIRAKISFNIKIKRLQSGLKQCEVCKILGIANATLSNWENNRRAIDITNALKLAQLYKCKIEDLLKQE